MGLLFAALAVAGFVGFAKCCSYDARNGWWITSLSGNQRHVLKKPQPVLKSGDYLLPNMA
jgi:hypothetical protein